MIKTVIALLIVTLSCAYPGTFETIDQSHPSRDNPDEIIRINGGPPTHVRFRTFGSDKIAQARAYGVSIQGSESRDTLIWVRASELYPTDRFFQKCFYQFARNP
jgi:hypothetical protein